MTPDLGANPEMLAFVQNYADMGFFSIILFLFIGAILTMIVQAFSCNDGHYVDYVCQRLDRLPSWVWHS